jgi:hypothetical protein
LQKFISALLSVREKRHIAPLASNGVIIEDIHEEPDILLKNHSKTCDG